MVWGNECNQRRGICRSVGKTAGATTIQGVGWRLTYHRGPDSHCRTLRWTCVSLALSPVEGKHLDEEMSITPSWCCQVTQLHTKRINREANPLKLPTNGKQSVLKEWDLTCSIVWISPIFPTQESYPNIYLGAFMKASWRNLKEKAEGRSLGVT